MSPVRVGGVVMAHPRRRAAAERLIAQAPGHLELVLDPEPDGPPLALRTAALAWSSMSATATHQLVLQDDAILSPGFFGHLEAAVTAVPDAALAFYAHWNSRNGAAVRLGAVRGGRWVSAAGEYTPTVALCLPVAVADGFAGYARRHGQSWGDDVVMARYLRSVGVPVLVAVPNIVDHDDLPSLVRHDTHGPRRSACFADPGPQTRWDVGPGRIDLDVVPFFKHGKAQCAVRRSGTDTPVWETIDADRWCTRSGLSLEDIRRQLLQVLASGSAAVGALRRRLDHATIEAAWTAAFLLGVVAGRVVRPPGAPPADPGWVERAISTLGPGGLCTDFGAAELASMHGGLRDLARAGLRAGSTADSGRVGAPPGRPRRGARIAMAGMHTPLGAYLAADLADRGYPVTEADPAALAGVDAVLRVPDAAADSADLVAGTRDLLAGAVRASVRHFVFLSCYPADPGCARIRPQRLAERACLAAAGQGAIRMTALRMGVPYGPGVAGDPTLTEYVRDALLGKPLRPGTHTGQPIDLVHVRDVAEAVDLVLRLRPPARIYNLGAARSVTARELAETVSGAVRRVPVEPTPCQAVLGARPVVVTDRAADELGWRPATGLVEGIRSFSQWLAYESEI